MDKRIIAVGGGKGGVGKSFVAVNLAVAIARLKKQVVMLDADLGGANLHTLFGIHRPDRTVHDFLEGRAASLDEVALKTHVPNLRIITGTSDVLGSAELESSGKQRLLSALNELDVDCLLIDVGAGTSTHTIDLFNAADARLVVLSPELTSVQNAYGFLKVAVYRRLQQVLASTGADARLRESLGDDAFKLGSTMEKIETFFSLVGGEDLGLDEPLRLLLRELNVKLIGNMLTKEGDRNVVWALKRMIGSFLDVDAEVAAAFRSNSKVRATINTGLPLAASGSQDYDVAEFARLARKLMGQDLAPIRGIRAMVANTLATHGYEEFSFGLEGLEIEIEEIDDPELLAEIEAAEADAIQTAPPPQAEEHPRARTQAHPEPRPAPLSDFRDSWSDLAAPEPENLHQHRFVSELDRYRRRSTRGVVHCELELLGHWFFGKVTAVEGRSVTVTGIHPFFAPHGSGHRFRVVNMSEEEGTAVPQTARVSFDHYDETSGTCTLSFREDADAHRFMRYVEERPSRPPTFLVGAA